MPRVFAFLTFTYGLFVTALPWIATPKVELWFSLIISGIGLLIVGSGVAMWRKAGPETR